jgi:hypothetical protein
MIALLGGGDKLEVGPDWGKWMTGVVFLGAIFWPGPSCVPSLCFLFTRK